MFGLSLIIVKNGEILFIIYQYKIMIKWRNKMRITFIRDLLNI